MHAEDKRDQKGVWQKVASCLYRYKSKGTYYAVVRRSGKLIRKSLETTNLPAAKRELRIFLNAQETAAEGAHAIRFGDYIDKFVEGRTGQPKTLRRYHDIAARIKASWPGGVRHFLRNVDLEQCAKWLSQFREQTATYNLARQWLFMFFEFAAANNVITKSPLSKTLLPPIKRSKPVRNAPSPADFLRILESVRSQTFASGANDTADLLEFMGNQGVGQAEAAGLRWQDVDLDGGVVTFFRAKTRTAFTVPVFPKVRPLLERLRDPEASPDARVFKVADPKKALEAACERLNLPKFSPRSLRRMFIILALERAVPVKTIAAWQGHQDGGVLILKTYSEVIGRAVNAAEAQKMA